MKDLDTPHRQALQVCASDLSDISYRFVDALTRFENRFSKGKHLGFWECVSDAIEKLDGCGGELEGWLKVKPWKDRDVVPEVKLVMRKAIVSLEALIEGLEEMDRDDLHLVTKTCQELEANYKRLSRDLKKHLECLLNPACDIASLSSPSEVNSEAFAAALDFLMSS